MPAPQNLAPRTFSPQALLGSSLGLCAGLAIVWVDTRPGWDDTGITAGALAISAMGVALARVPAWLATILVVGPILAAELSGGASVLLAIPFALAGALAGAFVRRRTVAV